MKIHWRCTVRFCVITPEACSSPDGPGQRCVEVSVSNENDFASVRLTMLQIHLLATEWRMANIDGD